jgi:hypothetical protein
MWQLALTSDRYIKNKVLGDGFGFDPTELRAQTTLAAFLMDTSAGLQDYFLVTGGYHSGPVSAIRFVGVVGLILFVSLLFANAKYSYSIILKSKGTPFFTLTLFLGLGVIYSPIGFIFIYGSLGDDIVQAISNLALLNLANRSLSTYLKNDLPARS